jgi:hypothetical protein
MKWITTEKIILLTFFGNKTAPLVRVLDESQIRAKAYYCVVRSESLTNSMMIIIFNFGVTAIVYPMNYINF